MPPHGLGGALRQSLVNSTWEQSSTMVERATRVRLYDALDLFKPGTLRRTIWPGGDELTRQLELRRTPQAKWHGEKLFFPLAKKGKVVVTRLRAF